MNIVMLCAGPERQDVVQAPRELITAVRVDGLEQTEHNPDIHGQDVQVPSDGAPEDGAEDGAHPQNHDFDGGSVFGRKTEGRRILVVDLVDVLVERAPVHGAVGPVVPGVLDHEEDGDLVGHFEEGREGDAGVHAEVGCHGVKEPVAELEWMPLPPDDICIKY